MTADKRAALIAQMLAKKNAANQAAAKAPSGSYDWSSLPEVKRAQLQKKLAENVGVSNPYMQHLAETGEASIDVDGRKVSNFSSYDYLSLAHHAAVRQAGHEALDKFGASANASRMVSGERSVHGALEAALAENYSKRDAMVLVSGHATNMGVLSHLFGPKDLVIIDSLAHNSIYAGAKASDATRRTFSHNDMTALEKILSDTTGQYEKRIIVVEGLYSMDGDTPPLKQLVALKQKHRAMLMVDEAHALGVLGKTGKGSFEQLGVDPEKIDIWMGTLSKTLCAAGGYLAADSELIEYLKHTMPSFVYSVGLSPVLAATSLAALNQMQVEPQRVQKLQSNARLFYEALKSHDVDTGFAQGYAVVPAIVGASIASVKISHDLLQNDIYALPIITPAVEERRARIRFFLQAEHTEEQLVRTAKLTAQYIAKHGAD